MLIGTASHILGGFFRRYSAQAALAKTPKARLKKKLKNHARVAVLGADTTSGIALSFLLKQNPIISRIFLYGAGSKGTAADLKHFDTRCRVQGFEGPHGVADSIRCAEIIVIMGLHKFPRSVAPEKRMKHEAGRVVRLARTCSRFAPRAIVLVCAHPVSYTLPLVTSVYKKTNWYHPGRLIGSADLTQIRINSLAARYQDLDPVSVHVPIIGGPESNNVVPLFSRATPIDLPREDAKALQQRIKKIGDEKTVKSKVKCELRKCPYSEAYGINRTVTTIALGLCGDNRAACAAFVRQNIINTCKHLVTTVKFGREGVEHNYGIPRLTALELKSLEKSLLSLKKGEKKARSVFGKLKIKSEETSMQRLSPFSESRNKKRC